MWTYDPTDLDTSTSSGRLNVVRLLIGDTDTNDQIVQNEEITFALSEKSDNVYEASSLTCRFIASKYSSLVDTQLDGALQENYSDLADRYFKLSSRLSQMAYTEGGKAELGVYAGGISKAAVRAARALPDRVSASFHLNQFSNPYASEDFEDYWEGR
ncbi:MAG: hypothetical protein WCS15_09360 [Prevotella sp.]